MLAAVVVPVLFLLTWGHLYFVFPLVTRPFHGGDLPPGMRVAVFSLSGLVVILGVVALLRPSRYPALLLLACLAMAAEVVLIAVEFNNNSLFDARWHWDSATVIAAFAVSGAGAFIWLRLFATSLRGKQCPDCAERVPQSVIDCPHCGYRFLLSDHLKRCEACQRPVKAEARVCRYCHHRFGEPTEPSSGAISRNAS